VADRHPESIGAHIAPPLVGSPVESRFYEGIHPIFVGRRDVSRWANLGIFRPRESRAYKGRNSGHIDSVCTYTSILSNIFSDAGQVVRAREALRYGGPCPPLVGTRSLRDRQTSSE